MSSVYVICEADSAWIRPPVKVGLAGDPSRRLSQIQTGYPRRLVVLHWFPCPHRDIAREIEQTFHARHEQVRMSGEWFDIAPFEAVGSVGLILCEIVRDVQPDISDREFGQFLVDTGLADLFIKVKKMREKVLQ